MIFPVKHVVLAVLCVVLAANSQAEEAPKKVRKINIKGYDPKRFNALVIAIDEYKHWSNLNCARNDGREIAKTLKGKYAFGAVKLLENENASRESILEALDSYISLGKEDSLMIYYAGHGWMDPKTKTGYWVPSEAREGKKFDYVANSQVVEDYFKKYKVKHLLVIADSCFSGTLLRGMGQAREEEWELPTGFHKPSRWVMTSGDLAPVADDSGGGHSPFASRVLQFLNHSDNPIFGVQDLYVYVRKNLEGQAIAQPMKTPAHMPGGEFIFCRLSGKTKPGTLSSASNADIEIIGITSKSKDDKREYFVKAGGMFSKAVYEKFDGGRFVEKGTAKVYDNKLKCTWWMMDSDRAYSWSRAGKLVEDESDGSFRLPTVDELISLVTRSKKRKEWARINTDVFPEHKRALRFWTAKKGFGNSTCIDFNTGKAEKTDRNESCGILAISKEDASE